MAASNNISYFFLGLGIGAAGALLFAPQSGADARNFLQSKAQEGSDMVKRQGTELRNMAAETLERSKQNLRDQVKTVTDAVEAGKTAYRETVATRA
jgi:gas vesicle protein